MSRHNKKANRAKKSLALAAARTPVKPRPEITVTVSSSLNQANYLIEAHSPVAHCASRFFNTPGDRALCEATILAFKACTAGRTTGLRNELKEQLDWVPFTRNGAPIAAPKLNVLLRTTSVTFAQLADYLAKHPKVATKRGRLIPPMRTLHRQLHRFDMQIELQASPGTEACPI